jgi:hypothetical protein
MWEPFNYFIGEWQGTGFGEPGTGQYVRSYEYVLNGTFIHVRNQSVYKSQSQNLEGEIHQDWGFISRDKMRNTYVLHQFHTEGFVNQYVMQNQDEGKDIVFITDNIENIPPGWRAKESYKILSPDEFIEVFELAAPGKDFELYTQCQLRRLA